MNNKPSSGLMLALVVLFSLAVVGVLLSQYKIPALQEIDHDALSSLQERELEVQDNQPEIESPLIITPEEVIIKIHHREYEPKTVTVALGTTVTWVNEDWIRGETTRAWPHVVKIDAYNLRSEQLRGSDTFSFRFTEPGEYRFIDSIYPSTLEGFVIVEEQGIPELTGGVVLDKKGTSPMAGLLVIVVLLSISIGVFLGLRGKQGRIAQAGVAVNMLSLLFTILILIIPAF